MLLFAERVDFVFERGAQLVVLVDDLKTAESLFERLVGLLGRSTLYFKLTAGKYSPRSSRVHQALSPQCVKR